MKLPSAGGADPGPKDRLVGKFQMVECPRRAGLPVSLLVHSSTVTLGNWAFWNVYCTYLGEESDPDTHLVQDCLGAAETTFLL